jgi:hypothetical protein
LLSQHARAHHGIDALCTIFAQSSCVAICEYGNDACENIDACNDSQERIITRIIPDVESSLKHEPVPNDSIVRAATSFKAKPRIAVLARLTKAATWAHASATDVRLTSHIEKFLSLLISKAARATKAIKASHWLFAWRAHHLNRPLTGQDTVDLCFHRHP